MAGLKGQSRLPNAEARARRNAQNLAASTPFVGANGAIGLAGDGTFQILVSATGGLQIVSNALGIKLATNPGMSLSGNGLTITLADTSLQLASGGISLRLATGFTGLQVSSGVKVQTHPTDSALIVDANGLRVQTATTGQRGTVLKASTLADGTGLTDNSGGTSGSGTIAAIGVVVTNPADTPADADALRDDLVANTIPSINTELVNLRNAVATLAAYCNGLNTQINTLLARKRTALQMDP